MTNLKKLDWSNQITDLSTLGGLTTLTYLFLNDHQNSDIKMLSGLNKLKRVGLKGNPIINYSPVDHVLMAERDCRAGVFSLQGGEYRKKHLAAIEPAVV